MHSPPSLIQSHLLLVSCMNDQEFVASMHYVPFFLFFYIFFYIHILSFHNFIGVNFFKFLKLIFYCVFQILLRTHNPNDMSLLYHAFVFSHHHLHICNLANIFCEYIVCFTLEHLLRF